MERWLEQARIEAGTNHQLHSQGLWCCIHSLALSLSGMDVSIKIGKTNTFEREFFQAEEIKATWSCQWKSWFNVVIPSWTMWDTSALMTCLRVDYSLPVFKLLGSVKAPWLLMVITHEGKWARWFWNKMVDICRCFLHVPKQKTNPEAFFNSLAHKLFGLWKP